MLLRQGQPECAAYSRIQ